MSVLAAVIVVVVGIVLVFTAAFIWVEGFRGSIEIYRGERPNPCAWPGCQRTIRVPTVVTLPPGQPVLRYICEEHAFEARKSGWPTVSADEIARDLQTTRDV